jgi:hypothetical protein
MPPAAVTDTFTAPAACAGVFAVIVVVLTKTMLVALWLVPGVGSKITAVVTPAPEMKFVPVMVTAWPPATGPLLRLTPVTVGCAAYV